MMQTEFNHAANESPRSGSSKRMTPIIWSVIVAMGIAVVLWLALHG
jgi:hypothetical protein